MVYTRNYIKWIVLSPLSVLLFLLLFFSAYAQNSSRISRDSLVAALYKIDDDTTKVKVYDKLSFTYSRINPDSGLLFARQALNLANMLKWEKGIALAHADLGVNYQAKAEYATALQHNMKSLAIYQRLGNKRSVAAILSGIASIYQLQGNYTNSLDYHLKALTTMEEIGDRKSQAIILDHIGTLYKEQKDYKLTSEYYHAALDIKKELNDAEGLALTYGNLGIVYDVQGDFKKALENHFAALEANTLIGNEYSMQVNMANVGIAYEHLGKLEKALAYHLKALRLSERLGNKSSIAINLGNTGEIYLAIAKSKIDTRSYKELLANAVNYLERAVMLCLETKFLAPTTEFIPHLTDAYVLSGNYRKAHEYQKMYSAIKDSIFSDESRLKIAAMESGRKIAHKEKDLKLMEQQVKIVELKLAEKHNVQSLYVLGITLLILILAITFKGVITYRKSNKKLTGEKRIFTNTIQDQYQELDERNQLLEEIAHRHSHDVRGHVTTILGLSDLFNTQDYADPNNKIIIDGITESAKSLDDVTREIVKKTED